MTDPLNLIIAGLFLYDIACALLGFTLAVTLFKSRVIPMHGAFFGLVFGLISQIVVPLILNYLWG